MNRMRKWIAWGLCVLLAATILVPQNVQATNPGSAETTDIVAGVDTDISISNVNVDGDRAGEKITVSFRAGADTGNRNYKITNIAKIVPVLDETFPFETDNEAYKVVQAATATVDASYAFTAKSDLQTGYYPVSFAITYERKAEDGTVTSCCVTKVISVKLQAKEESTASDEDVSLKVKSAPSGTYGKSCKIQFQAKAKNGKIVSVTPVISDGFPFETEGDAYRSITSKGTTSLKCEYEFKVREDVMTGYQMVSFLVGYQKDGKSYETTRSVNVKLTGKKSSSEGGAGGAVSGNTSTPRLMVTGYDVGKDNIYENETFTLTLHMENTAKSTISNIKLSLTSEENQFIPENGAGNVFIESMKAGEEKEVTFQIKPASGLEEKNYPLLVKTEYENSKAEAFSAEDTLYIPVSLRQRLSVTDVYVAEDSIEVGDTVELSATVNNLGEGSLHNVTVYLSGDNIEDSFSYVGNVEPGKSGTVDMLTKATVVTEGDHKKNKMIITYEDKDGNVQEETVDVDLRVAEPVYDNLEKVKNAKDYSGVAKKTGTAVIILVVVAGIIYLGIRRKKKKQQILDDFIENGSTEDESE